MSERIVVSSFPAQVSENPYLELLYGALGDYDVVLYFRNVFSCRKLLKYRREVDLIHVHWLFDEANSPVRLMKFVFKLFEARFLGYGIVWTVHNIRSHEGGVFDKIARYFLAHLSNAVIVHSESVKTHVGRMFRIRGKISVIPHGNYISCYRNTVGRDDARRKLNISEESFVYLFFGLIKPYKGLQYLVESFSKVGGDNLLLIVGKPVDEGIRHEVEVLAAVNSKIRFIPEYVPEDDVQFYFKAADVVVLPFTEITTSGSLMLALSFGKPVITVDRGVIPEIVSEEYGLLLGDLDELTVALDEIKNRNLNDMGGKALDKAMEYSWDDIASAHRNVYEESLNLK